MNPKRVRRLLREDNLLCLRKRKFVVTTDSNHGRRIYFYPQEEFIFLAVILDAYSRRVIGWALTRTMEDDFDAGGLKRTMI